MPVKKEVGRALTGTWTIGMCESPCKAPADFCYGCWCTCCAVYGQRNELLDLTGEPYVCCAGLCPCGPLGDPCSSRNPCMCIEAFCCVGLALSGNRFMVQTRFDKMNTPCDDAIICCTCLFVYGIEIARCFVEIPQELDFCADCIIMTVNGCMHAQQQVEIREIKKGGYRGPPASVISLMPPKQKQMLMQVGREPGGAHGTSMVGVGHNHQPPQHQMGWQQQGPPRQQQMQQQVYSQQMGQPATHQVQCGGCQQIFGSPARGVTVACPHCGTHNHVN